MTMAQMSEVVSNKHREKRVYTRGNYVQKYLFSIYSFWNPLCRSRNIYKIARVMKPPPIKQKDRPSNRCSHSKLFSCPALFKSALEQTL